MFFLIVFFVSVMENYVPPQAFDSIFQSFKPVQVLCGNAAETLAVKAKRREVDVLFPDDSSIAAYIAKPVHIDGVKIRHRYGRGMAVCPGLFPLVNPFAAHHGSGFIHKIFMAVHPAVLYRHTVFFVLPDPPAVDPVPGIVRPSPASGQHAGQIQRRQQSREDAKLDDIPILTDSLSFHTVPP